MEQEKVNPEHYDLQFETDQFLVQAVLEDVHNNEPYFKFEEPFSHNVTSMSKCIRQRWFRWQGTEKILKEPEPIYQAWGWMGNAVEDHIIDLTKKAGLF